MADETLVLKGQGNVDVQIGGAGNNWIYLSPCAAMSGPTVPFGGTEIRWCQDPKRAGGFKKSSKIKTAPDQVSFDLMTKLGKVNHLEGLNCPFTLRARFANCGEREDPSNYNPIMLAYCNSELQEKSYDDLVITDPGNEDEILVTTPVQADDEMRIKTMVPARIGTAATLGDQAINDVEYCDSSQCGDDCGDTTDGCSIIYGATDADTTPYASSNLIKGVKDNLTEFITWTTTPVLGLNGNLDGVECAGRRVIVSSNSDSAIAYSDTPTDQDTWNVVSIPTAPTANHNALFARTATEIWLGCNSGFIYKSIDKGVTWAAVHQAEITTQNINAVWAHDKDLAYAAGDNGVMLRTQDGGETWENITETSTTGANILVITVPEDRPREVYIGTNDGMIYRSKNSGGTLAATGDFVAMSFDGQGVGTVDDLAWCGPCGSNILFILHNDAGPRGRILRDLSGGAGGADVEIVSDYTQIISGGIDLNALACCDVNEVVAMGELNNSFPVVIKVS